MRALAGQNKYGFTYTQGQRMTDPARKFQQLSKEEVLRQSPGGGQVFRDAAANNDRQLDNTLAGLSDRFGARAATTPAEMVQGEPPRLSRRPFGLSQAALA
ncbi:hypothetical protein [Xanthomonas albilineans]|uniref:hypothetical protein n=1 Tax=Xanthomonas albilineans TaxID=29447 RepID=UPI0018B0A151|nr:hypothetical protein [Xanthomonas albilineans]